MTIISRTPEETRSAQDRLAIRGRLVEMDVEAETMLAEIGYDIERMLADGALERGSFWGEIMRDRTREIRRHHDLRRALLRELAATAREEES